MSDQKSQKRVQKSIAIESKNTPKAFFKYANSKLKTKSTMPLEKTDGTKTTNDTEKAEDLNKFFSSIFTKENLNNFPLFED